MHFLDFETELLIKLTPKYQSKQMFRMLIELPFVVFVNTRFDLLDFYNLFDHYRKMRM